ncbi:hypothetical protein N7462_009192 [Penicillium macrosclerotiorum]|uniref:uncharacterized protein n=1 Tax=Penicillium macrosclerotiorum TaxID=303699 RepID=UPI002549555E|nr:uncharacterized protein N7462_009192 [Penicillium macrosclerotiorum]KAJ5673753.1 hypothetical protein N7462_009192 [Penicillium macrosclerotiorum]
MSSNQGHNHQETYGFSSTTQEDLSFGFELYRARRNHPRASNETNSEELNRVPSFQPLENAVSAPERLPSSCTTIHGPEDAELPIVSMTSHEASALDLTLTRATSPGPSLDLEDRTDNGQLVVSRARNITTVDSVHSATSIDWETVGSSGSSSISTSTDEDIGGTSLLCDAHGLGLELQNGTLEGFAGSAYDQHSSRSRLSSASSDISSSDMKQDEENSPKGSFALPDYDTASIAGSNASNRQPFIFTQSEAFVTQERLDQAREASYSSPSAIPLPHSRQCSAEVGIAFPGIYQELLDQWTREAQGNLENYAHGGQHRAHRPSQLPIISLTPETPFVREAARASSSTALLWSYENLASLGAPAPFGTSQFVYRAFVPPSSFISPLSLTEDMQDSGNVPYTMLNPPGHSDSASQPHSNRSSDARHSFGLHISLRNVSILDQ